MGTELLIPAALSLLSGGMSYYNTRQTAKKQDNALASQIQHQRQVQQEADARTRSLIQQQGQRNDSAEKAKGMAANTGVLAANQQQAMNPLRTQGAVSQAYANSGANAVQGIANYGNNQADLLSSIAAPGQERQNNIKNLDNYNSDIGLLKRKAEGQNYLDQLKFQSIHRNPWLDFGASMASGLGEGYSRGMFGLGDPTSKPYSGYMDNATKDYGYGDIAKYVSGTSDIGYSPFLDQSSVINDPYGYFARNKK